MEKERICNRNVQTKVLMHCCGSHCRCHCLQALTSSDLAVVNTRICFNGDPRQSRIVFTNFSASDLCSEASSNSRPHVGVHAAIPRMPCMSVFPPHMLFGEEKRMST